MLGWLEAKTTASAAAAFCIESLLFSFITFSLIFRRAFSLMLEKRLMWIQVRGLRPLANLL